MWSWIKRILGIIPGIAIYKLVSKICKYVCTAYHAGFMCLYFKYLKIDSLSYTCIKNLARDIKNSKHIIFFTISINARRVG